MPHLGVGVRTGHLQEDVDERQREGVWELRVWSDGFQRGEQFEEECECRRKCGVLCEGYDEDGEEVLGGVEGGCVVGYVSEDDEGSNRGIGFETGYVDPCVLERCLMIKSQRWSRINEN